MGIRSHPTGRASELRILTVCSPTVFDVRHRTKSRQNRARHPRPYSNCKRNSPKPSHHQSCP
ncbi:hypothetical protein PILCRDRAFT_732917 [Piloderma croceum F 1598]|uniref:Uncharacterized protein n=1 Tax=Piloderma croceum (strain F 1598) TaxID=765440 RepID=A0A0C3EZI2_PILCF|nr:hypothetical protein PILCRDRAFT_732917 [Piloderma croceum F 1598]